MQKDLQFILSFTSLHKIKWGEINLPFDSFLLRFSQPIIDNAEKAFPYVLVSRRHTDSAARMPNNFAKGTLHFLLISKEVNTYRAVSSGERKQIESDLQQKRLTQTAKANNRLNDRLKGIEFTDIEMDLGMSSNRCVEDEPDSFTGYADIIDRTASTIKTLTRLALGLGLYLKNLPAGSSHVANRKTANQRSVRGGVAVDSAADICSVQSHYKLNDEQKILLGHMEDREGKFSNREMSCHFREAYWRRPKGLGQDPAAEKTEWVGFSIVRRDRLKPGQLPMGSQKNI